MVDESYSVEDMRRIVGFGSDSPIYSALSKGRISYDYVGDDFKLVKVDRPIKAVSKDPIRFSQKTLEYFLEATAPTRLGWPPSSQIAKKLGEETYVINKYYEKRQIRGRKSSIGTRLHIDPRDVRNIFLVHKYNLTKCLGKIGVKSKGTFLRWNEQMEELGEPILQSTFTNKSYMKPYIVGLLRSLRSGRMDEGRLLDLRDSIRVRRAEGKYDSMIELAEAKKKVIEPKKELNGFLMYDLLDPDYSIFDKCGLWDEIILTASAFNFKATIVEKIEDEDRPEIVIYIPELDKEMKLRLSTS